MNRSPFWGLAVAFAMLGAPSAVRADAAQPESAPAEEADEAENPLPHQPVDPEALERFFDTPRLYLERSYLDYRLPMRSPPKAQGGKRLIFDAQIAPHLMLWSNINQLGRKANRPWALTWTLTFMLRARMLDTDSAPVRTPSYIPRFNVQFFWLQRRSQFHAWLFESRLSLGHHSNGQQRCLFGPEGAIEERDDCDQPAPKEFDPAMVQRENGSFTTNFITLAAHWRDMKVDKHGWDVESHSTGLILEAHPDPLFFVSDNTGTQKKLYGNFRMRLEYEYEVHIEPRHWHPVLAEFHGRFRASAFYEHIFNIAAGENHLFEDSAERHHIANYALRLELAYTFNRLGGMGLFLRHHRGRDDYNLSFIDTVDWYVFGIVYGAGPPLKVKMR